MTHTERGAHQGGWTDLLSVNPYGRQSLTLSTAKQVAMMDRTGWYVAPFSLGWTVGKAVDEPAPRRNYFHVLGARGEPLFFESVEAALTFLRIELRILRVPVLNCGPA